MRLFAWVLKFRVGAETNKKHPKPATTVVIRFRVQNYNEFKRKTETLTVRISVTITKRFGSFSIRIPIYFSAFLMSLVKSP